MKNNKDRKNLNEMGNDPNSWKGIFYFNKKDPRIIVPKLNPSMGWTLNFGNVYTYLVIIAVILIILLFR